MDLGDMLNLLTVISIAVAGWLRPRITTRGRLLIDINQLGDAVQKLPDSEAKAALESRLLESATRLAAWLDPINRFRRRVQSGVSWSLYGGALAIVFFCTPYFSLDPAGQLMIVIVAMFATLVSMFIAMLLIEKVGAKHTLNVEKRAAAERASKVLVKPTSN